MKALLQPLEDLAGYSDLRRQIRTNRGIIEVSGCLDSQKAQLAAGLSEGKKAVLLIAENDLKARALYEDCRLYDPEALFYPRRDLIFFQADVSGNLLTRQRMQVIKALFEQKKTTIITSTGGCMDLLLPFRVLTDRILSVSAGDELDLTETARELASLGYERCGAVEAAGQFAVRGDILDVFSLTEETPWRIELWGDEVDSIRSFDPESQRSVENLESVLIFPAAEEPDREEGTEYLRRLTDTFPDYLPENSLIILDEPVRILEDARAVFLEYTEAMKRRLEEKQIAPEETKRMITPEMLTASFERHNCVALSMLERSQKDWAAAGKYSILTRSVSTYQNQFPMLVRDLKRWKKDGFRVILLSASRTRAKRLAEELQQEGLNAFFSEEEGRLLEPGEILVTRGSARRGFEYPMQKFVLITETDIFGTVRRKKRHRKPEYSGQKIRSFQELTVGDAVVHETHGLGIYRGIEKVEMDHVVKDYIRIEYAGGSSLYVLASSLDVLQKYSSADGKHPRINKLGGNEWNRTRSRVRSAVRDIAEDLVRLYAARQGRRGYVFGPDTVWQREFEELFPFEETEDQLAAIEDTKRDMESPKIMDRLICGDVGYGKTEIAIRAAFKAVQENKQVIMLCPTTILAQQHYNTFTQRMKDYPVRIDQLSRFRTAAQQKKTIEDLRRGLVDILIGTHRVLSEDVVCKDLGLLIIDEEQRFGVAHKEKIKQTRENVDVLTLTATPIPRTLHMSLIGIRDMSVLEEPPLDRMPIQTYVMEYDEELIREAVSRELAREGQVYLVYNRVRGIADMARRVSSMVPDASVAYAHGQMNERELERIMYDFVAGEIDVLVSTTIIETGMDISNVNTLIICDAERLGLSQLYQLRGRVGRSNRNAYAFLMYRKDRILKEEAEKRLHAIREFTDLGSGVRIAMRDLEIRGAGNLLGAEQHGHMEAVGYDLYCKMLSEAVREAKGEQPREDFETTVDLAVSAYIPPEYIPEEGQKLDMYKRIAGIEDAEEAEDMLDEMVDRFGDPPRSVQNLLKIALIKAMMHRVYVSEIRQGEDEIRLLFYGQAELDPGGIPELLASEAWRSRLLFRAAPDPQFTLKIKAKIKRQEELLRLLQQLAEDLQILKKSAS